MTLRVALELTLLEVDAGGTARAARGLLAALRAHAGVEVVPLRQPPGRGGRVVRGLLRELAWMPLAAPLRAREAGADVLHCPGPLVPVRPGRPPLVVTVHDDLPWSHPEWMGRANVLQHRLVVERALPRAAGVLTVSDATRRALLSRFPLDPARVSVAPHGVDPAFTPGPAGGAGVPGPYLLAVGTLQPRKGLDTALAAFERCAAAGAPHHLVVAGARGWRDDAIVASFARTPVRDRVHLLGAVPDARLVALLRGADLLLVPSRYEGFGLPALEGMACGTPVVAADATSLPEVVGDAGELVPPGDEAAWGERIDALLADPSRRAAMRARGLARAASFTWKRCAERTVAAYERAIG